MTYIYVIHDITSGFVTNKCRRNTTESSRTEQVNVGIEESELLSWRSTLKVGDDERILVSLAWCHDEDLRLATMHPFFFACDMTFGVNKEQRNLLSYCGVDGNNQAFTALHCFMPSKQCIAYHWALTSAAKCLLTPAILKRNHCFATDNELALYSPIRSAVHDDNLLPHTRHRLDQWHVFSKEWMNVVQPGFRDTTKRQQIGCLKAMLLKLFDYVETVSEANETYTHCQSYYLSIKGSLQNEDACKIIEKLMRSLQSNLQYLGNHKFINCCCFDFKGDSIAEASYSPLKKGDDSIASNSTLRTAGAAIVRQSELKSSKKNRYVIRLQYNSIPIP